MAQYIIGKHRNKRRPVYAEQSYATTNYIAEAKTLIVRGIGYRAFALRNDLLSKTKLAPAFTESSRPVYSGDDSDPVEKEFTEAALYEFTNSKYLVVRAGHTRDMCLPVRDLIACSVSKKDRKLTIASANKIHAANLAKEVYSYRPPSAYTGRGVRIKHERPARKAGKKDKQRGRAF